jgi:hypothetical protein
MPRALCAELTAAVATQRQFRQSSVDIPAFFLPLGSSSLIFFPSSLWDDS